MDKLELHNNYLVIKKKLYNKEYYEKNRDPNKPRRRERNENITDDEIKKRRLEANKKWGIKQWYCDICKIEYTNNNKFQHLRSKTHINNEKMCKSI